MVLMMILGDVMMMMMINYRFLNIINVVISSDCIVMSSVSQLSNQWR